MKFTDLLLAATVVVVAAASANATASSDSTVAVANIQVDLGVSIQQAVTALPDHANSEQPELETRDNGEWACIQLYNTFDVCHRMCQNRACQHRCSANLCFDELNQNGTCTLCYGDPYPPYDNETLVTVSARPTSSPSMTTTEMTTSTVDLHTTIITLATSTIESNTMTTLPISTVSLETTSSVSATSTSGGDQEIWRFWHV